MSTRPPGRAPARKAGRFRPGLSHAGLLLLSAPPGQGAGHGLGWGLAGGRHRLPSRHPAEAEAVPGSWEAAAGRPWAAGDSGERVGGLVPLGWRWCHPVCGVPGEGVLGGRWRRGREVAWAVWRPHHGDVGLGTGWRWQLGLPRPAQHSGEALLGGAGRAGRGEGRGAGGSSMGRLLPQSHRCCPTGQGTWGAWPPHARLGIRPDLGGHPEVLQAWEQM